MGVILGDKIDPVETFVPRRLLRGAHRMTMTAWALPRRYLPVPTPEARRIRVAPDTEVLAHCHWQADRASAPTLLLLHGLSGSSRSHYVRGLAGKAWAQGWNVVRLNQRNCGGTEALAPGLFHAGLTHDPVVVLEALMRDDGVTAVVIAGYSLGGNLALKLAGEYGAAAPAALRGVAAVSPIIEVGECTRALEADGNWPYEWLFVRDLKAQMRRKARHHPGRFDLSVLTDVRTVRGFDNRVTAPHFGFRDADDYYHHASAMRVIDQIRVPACIVTAEDDPFVPVAQFTRPPVATHPHVELIVTRHGGHCGFLTRASRDDDGYWAERQVLRFAMRVAPRLH